MKRFLPILIFLTIIGSSFFAGNVYAAGGPIPKLNLPCNLTGDPEFNSLRPYQASTCGDAGKALFCSNTLQFTESFTDFPGCNRPNGPEGSWICSVNKYIAPHTLTIDMAGSQLPILGNTELTQNSQSSTDQIDDATKMSEYVSWYLEGTLNRAETGSVNNTDLADSAGPIQKIMPQVILQAQRVATIASTSGTTTYTPDNDDGSTSPVQPVTEPESHNQIVVCAKKQFSIPLWLTNLFHLPSIGIGQEIPINCYAGNNTGTSGDAFRLSNANNTGGEFNWEGEMSGGDISNIVNWIGQHLINLIPDGTRWKLKRPPLPWSDANGKPFTSEITYEKAYNEWRGQVCGYWPGTTHLVCIGAWPWVNNPYADLFPYIPLASTPDKHGSETDPLFDVEFEPLGGTQITNPISQTVKSGPLYFSHAQEDLDLSNFLNSSYLPASVSGVPEPKTTEDDTSTCRIVDIKVNPGDNLFAGQPHGVVAPGVSYTITAVPCVTTRVVTTQRYCPPGGGTCTISTNISYPTHCDAEITLKIPTITKNPWVTEIWNSTVSDSESTFRRIYPQVGLNAPVSCIEDNQTKTAVTYTGNDPVGGGTDTFKVTGIGGGDTTGNASLYFPHVGSIYTYFLKGIQTALRPKGYADPTPVSGKYCNNIQCGQLPQGLPTASGSCALGSTSSRVGNIPDSLRQIIDAASQTYKTPPNLILGIMYGEGLFNPGRLSWTDANVKSWATCQPVPGCNPTGDDNFMGFNGNDFTNITPHILPDLQKLDPTRKTLSQCNLLDAIYAEAYNLHASAAGGGGLPATCFGLSLQSTIPNSCSWNSNQYEDAIKISESGYTNMCFTKENSCATGGGTAATCPSGDTCETINNRYSDPSHNGCVWDVGHGN